MRIWKPLQMPSTSPPSAAKRATARHDRREARDRAAAEVVAVREPAGEDDRRGRRAGAPSPRARRARRPRRAARARAARPGRRSSPGRRRRRSRGRGAGVASRRRGSRARSRSSRSAGSRAAARTSARPAARASAASLGVDLELDEPADPRSSTAKPRWRSELSTAWPCGSRMPGLRPDEHGRLHPSTTSGSARYVVEADPGQAARTPRRSGRACPSTTSSGQLRARGRSCPSRATRSSRGRTACRTTAAGRRARTRRRARSATSRA